MLDRHALMRNKKNKLSGSVDLSKLPVEMTKLSLRRNMLTGSIDLTRLPEGFAELRLGWNTFSGEVSFERLPASMTFLQLAHTNLRGEITVSRRNRDNFQVFQTKITKHRESEYSAVEGFFSD